MEVYNILFNRLLSETAKRQASDLHLSAGSVPAVRKDGRLIKLEQEKIVEQEALNQIIKSFLNEENLKVLEKNRELTIVKKLGGNFRFKINIYYQKNLLAATFRLIKEDIRDFEALNIPRTAVDFTGLTSGLLIIVGPYGSGKTTTIGAFIENINQNKHQRILTIEDPIEIIFTSKQSVIEQRQVGRDVLSWNEGLRHCQNEDIDILALGNIGENLKENINLILDIASSNALVILEMNIDSAIRAIEKILNYYPPSKLEATRVLLADVLEGVIAQKLLPKNGGGMSLAMEILSGTPALKSVIREGKIKQIQSIVQTSGEQGMVSMVQSLVSLVQKGEVSREDALANAPDKEDFNIMIK